MVILAAFVEPFLFDKNRQNGHESARGPDRKEETQTKVRKMEEVEAIVQVVFDRDRVTDDAQKRALLFCLLHAAGVDVQEIYFTLVSEEESPTFEETMKVKF